MKLRRFAKFLVLALSTLACDATSTNLTRSDLERLPAPYAGTSDFQKHIEPIFAEHCYGCHGPDKQRGDLRLDVKAIALKGGSSGAAIIPGKSSESRLIQYVAGIPEEMTMPQKGERLTSEEIGMLRAWINQGAQWPDGLEPPDVAERIGHWAFKKPVRDSPPTVQDGTWPLTPIDYFILNRLEKEGLRPSGEADRKTLIRRLSLDLLGLPPTPEEVIEFISDPRSNAYALLVDRILSSPRYGERWARHWLDTTRFAESSGFETNLERKNAWPYRDYVIRSLNENKPYDQFLLEQLAGDAVGIKEATGFIVGGPWDAVKSPDINLTLQQRADELHDMVSTTASTFLGLTVGCARCHNHKFDPISQKDYYSMQAIFAGVQHGESALTPPDHAERLARAEQLKKDVARLEEELTRFEPLANPHFEQTESTHLPAAEEPSVASEHPLRSPVHARLNVERFSPIEAKYVRFTVAATSDAEPCIDELEIYTAEEQSRNIALARAGTKATASGTYPNSEIHRLEHIHDGQIGNSRSWISNEPGKGWVQLEFPEPVVIHKILWGRDREEKFSDRLATRYTIEIATIPDQWTRVAGSNDRQPYKSDQKKGSVPWLSALEGVELKKAKQLLAQKETLKKEISGLTTYPTVYAGRFEKPEPTFLLYRGEPTQKREPVTPGGIEGMGPRFAQSGETPEQDRRIGLAKWLVHPENPLTARVMVNRIWQYHFGRGIVDTPSDFGLNGSRPTHPELLDWLATEFVASGWDIKGIHRLIVLSKVYRQTSQPDAKALAVDANAALLWRFPPHRLEAEPLRDSILAVSGALNLTMGGPGFHLFEPNANYVKVYTPIKEFGPEEFRRMVYQSKPRMRLDDTFGPFDCPDAGQIAPKRNTSTTPLQALSLLNSPFILEQSSLLAQRLEREAGSVPRDQVLRAFWLTFNRKPAPVEADAAVQVISQHGLPAFCRALLNANEFLYVF